MMNKKTNLQAVIFDMDGVIVDNMNYHKKAWEKFLEKYDPGLSMENFVKHFGKTNRDLLQIAFSREISSEESEKYGEEKEALYRDIYKDNIQPVNGLIPLLQKLKNSGIKIAVATSAPANNVDFTLEKTGVKQYFDIINHVAHVTHGKPHPEIYLRSLSLLGVRPSESIVFEDSPAGISSARAAGIKVIGLCTTHPAKFLKNTILNIKDFEEIDIDDLIRLNEQK